MIKVPTFHFNTTLNRDVKLSDYQGMNVVLYFFPKDNTPGCILEAQDFRDSMAAFAALNTVILGVSRDILALHQNFKEKHAIPFELISDRDEKFCNHFQVIREKQLYGISYDSIVRSTFLINTQGEVVKEWREVSKVSGHVAEVLDAVRELEPKSDHYNVPTALLRAHRVRERSVNFN
jgi:thioredoxin-dependent peroxiredoxin